jgi:hypothetical protein
LYESKGRTGYWALLYLNPKSSSNIHKLGPYLPATSVPGGKENENSHTKSNSRIWMEEDSHFLLVGVGDMGGVPGWTLRTGFLQGTQEVMLYSAFPEVESTATALLGI